MEKYVGSFKSYRVYEVDSEGNYKNETENIYLKYNANTGYYDMWQRGKKCGHCTKELEVVDYAEPKIEPKVEAKKNEPTSSTSGTVDFFKRVEKEIEETLRSEVKYDCGEQVVKGNR